jgi:hypothetical protein
MPTVDDPSFDLNGPFDAPLYASAIGRASLELGISFSLLIGSEPFAPGPWCETP